MSSSTASIDECAPPSRRRPGAEGDARAVAAEIYCTTRLNDSVFPAPDSPAPPRDVAIRGRGVRAAAACALAC